MIETNRRQFLSYLAAGMALSAGAQAYRVDVRNHPRLAPIGEAQPKIEGERVPLEPWEPYVTLPEGCVGVVACRDMEPYISFAHSPEVPPEKVSMEEGTMLPLGSPLTVPRSPADVILVEELAEDLYCFRITGMLRDDD